MTESKHLGIFWGTTALYLTETSETSPETTFHVPFQKSSKSDSKKSSIDPMKVEFVRNLKSALAENNISSSSVNLSLPTKDIIFRSFTIPWMQRFEVNNVVEFEVTKYIPFSLDELAFSFQPITITENSIKRIRIIFVAIKNDALRKYMRALEAASLDVNIIEPAASSLIRALSFKDLIPKDETIALIEKGDVGRIIIIDNNVPQFVREFYLSSTLIDQGADEPDHAVKKLTNEVRISLNYFNRQNEELNVKKIFLLTSDKEENLTKDLEQFLDIPVTEIALDSVLENMSEVGIDMINAYGASISSKISLPASFNLSKPKAEIKKTSKPVVKRPINIKSLIKTAVICIPLIILSLSLSIYLKKTLINKVTTLSQKLQSFKDQDTDFLERKELILKTKLTYFQNTRTQSNTALFLLLIPELLPKGAWIQNIDIVYDDSSMFEDPAIKKKNPKLVNIEIKPTLVLTLDGYAYSENKNNQFQLINTFLGQLKKSKEFSNAFQDISLETTNAQKLSEYDVTFFKIVCTKKPNEYNKKIK